MKRAAFVAQVAGISDIQREVGVFGRVRLRLGSAPLIWLGHGRRALWQKKGAWNRDTFKAFLCDGLLPVLERGSVIVLDNARFHQGGQIHALVEKAGCSLLYLPPYSPDLNPIELAWSYLKNLVRSWAPREDDARERDIQRAATLLPPQDATNWFKHCGIQ